jgi:branched-subunit amino acid transport protein
MKTKGIVLKVAGFFCICDALLCLGIIPNVAVTTFLYRFLPLIVLPYAYLGLKKTAKSLLAYCGVAVLWILVAPLITDHVLYFAGVVIEDMFGYPSLAGRMAFGGVAAIIGVVKGSSLGATLREGRPKQMSSNRRQ